MNLSSKPHASRYPWGEWFAKGVFSLRKGVDYLCGTGTMISNARNRASKLGLGLSILPWKGQDGFTVTVRSRRATKKDQPEAATDQTRAGRKEARVPRA